VAEDELDDDRDHDDGDVGLRVAVVLLQRVVPQTPLRLLQRPDQPDVERQHEHQRQYQHHRRVEHVQVDHLHARSRRRQTSPRPTRHIYTSECTRPPRRHGGE